MLAPTAQIRREFSGMLSQISSAVSVLRKFPLFTPNNILFQEAWNMKTLLLFWILVQYFRSEKQENKLSIFGNFVHLCAVLGIRTKRYVRLSYNNNLVRNLPRLFNYTIKLNYLTAYVMHVPKTKRIPWAIVRGTTRANVSKTR